MGLFNKRICSICNSEIGLLQLGDKKLADGDLCKNCAAKLSPFFSGYKKAKLADIKRQLSYRETNLKNLATFKSTLTIGNNTKFYINETTKKFLICSSSDWNKKNPDIIDISSIRDFNVEVKEDANEIFDTDDKGEEVSFDPPKFEYEYTFGVNIMVNHPYFEKIHVELSDSKRPTSPTSEEYKALEDMAQQLAKALTGKETVIVTNNTYVEEGEVLEDGSWKCECGTINTSKFCTECGKPKPGNTPKFCPECGTELKGAKFCPECGYKV